MDKDQEIFNLISEAYRKNEIDGPEIMALCTNVIAEILPREKLNGFLKSMEKAILYCWREDDRNAPFTQDKDKSASIN